MGSGPNLIPFWSGANATFEIKWKAGDITWLPYYQVTHLQALTDYMDLLGVAKIPHGQGNPPQDDPQIFINSITPLFTPSTTSQISLSSPRKALFLSFFHLLATPFCSSLFSAQPTSVTLDIKSTYNTMPQLRGIDHPRFTRVSPTHYLLNDPDQSLQTTIHVGHIADILTFDVEIQAQGGITGLQTMPLDFSEFSAIWNMGAQLNNSCHISQVILATDNQLITPSTHPVHLSDFHVTPEQCGLSSAPPVSPATAELSKQAAINCEVAAIFIH